MMKKTLLFSLTLIFGSNLRANYSFPAECLTDQFACDNKNCIPFVWKCDGSDDCGDNSDESQCITGLNTTQCKSDEMECKNKRCINLELKCDSRNDCGDGSDEENCNFDEPDQYCDLGTNFLCKNGKCISRSLTCNQVDNCLDNSDEAYNEDPYCSPTQGCRDGYYKCKKSGYCIQDSLVCDGVHFNCGENDDSDELGCKQKICTYGQFKCANGRCISSEMQCNKQNECGDNSDEENCVYNACSGVKCPFYASCVLGFNQKARCYCTLECRPDYNPVCGSDLKTYRSECFMQVESCQAQKEIKVVPNIECKCAKMKCSHYGTCAMTWNGEIGCRCSRECSPERKPLCGSNYQTYRNKCYLKMDSCIKQKEIFVLYESPCKCSSMKCPHFGMCRTNSDGYAECVCTTECSPIRKPVCGSNFRTYRNICYLRMDSCMKKKHIAVLYKAGCGNIRIS